ncbi:MAG TPA: hypothetical protein VJB89_03485 [Candidatus Nanoarchaeia archaeon]|nr:hypothetical protein [Candidatus Nanoarchaeia archaeon]
MVRVCGVLNLFLTLNNLPIIAKLNKNKVEKIIKQKRFGLPASVITRQLKITERRVNQVYQIYLENAVIVVV